MRKLSIFAEIHVATWQRIIRQDRTATGGQNRPPVRIADESRCRPQLRSIDRNADFATAIGCIVCRGIRANSLLSTIYSESVSTPAL